MILPNRKRLKKTDGKRSVGSGGFGIQETLDGYLSWCPVPAQKRYPLFLLVDEQEYYYDGETDYYGNHNWDNGVQRWVFTRAQPVIISVVYLEVTHI